MLFSIQDTPVLNALGLFYEEEYGESPSSFAGHAYDAWIVAINAITGTLLVITSNGLDPEILFGASRLGFTVGGAVAISAA